MVQQLDDRRQHRHQQVRTDQLARRRQRRAHCARSHADYVAEPFNDRRSDGRLVQCSHNISGHVCASYGRIHSVTIDSCAAGTDLYPTGESLTVPVLHAPRLHLSL